MTGRKGERNTGKSAHFKRKSRWNLKILGQKLRLMYLSRCLKLGDLLDSGHLADCPEFITVCDTVMLCLQITYELCHGKQVLHKHVWDE